MTPPITGLFTSPSRCGLMKSPEAGMKTRSVPAKTPGSDMGKITRRKVLANGE